MKRRIIMWALIFILVLTFVIENYDTFFRPDYKKNNVAEEQMNINRTNIPVKLLLSQAFLDYPPEEIILLAFKKEMTLELWVKDGNRKAYMKTYPFTASIGSLGPKLREGDKQIPEGWYSVEYLNPNSSYHLSIKLNYPNEFDLEKAKLDGRNNPGGDIFIHGKDKTIGCIPIGNDAIEELYSLVKETGISHVKIYIFPSDIRHGGNFPKCTDCPKWTSELYSKLKKILIKFDNN